MKKHIPNFLTLMNLFFGCLAIVAIFEGDFECVIYYTLLSGLMDFFDGFAARLLGVTSAIGKDLDSLSDVISFGAVPSFLVFAMVKQYSDIEYLPYVAFVIVLLAALRLAKFNNDSRQSDSFHGVPVPAVALFICPIPVLIEEGILGDFLTNPVYLLLVTVGFSLMMVVDSKMLALKFNGFQWKGNQSKYIVIVTGALLLVSLQLVALPFIILLYVLLSIIDNSFRRNNNVESV